MVRPIHAVEQPRSPIAGLELMTLRSAHHFPRHSRDQLGIGVVLHGAQRSWSGIGSVEAGPGDVIMSNPGEMHDGIPLGGAPRCWRMIYLDPALLQREVETESMRLLGAVPPVARDPELARRVGSLFRSLTTADAGGLLQEERLLRTLVYLLRRHGGARMKPQAVTASVARALERLHAAPELPVTLAELAALTGVSRFQLLRGFARHLGTTPHAYLLQLRVRLARRLLAAGLAPAEAAARSSFADQSHLTRVFLRQVGVTPGRYRAAVA